jgi:hypothetical protein
MKVGRPRKIKQPGTRDWTITMVEFPDDKMAQVETIATLKKITLGRLVRDYVLSGVAKYCKRAKINN